MSSANPQELLRKRLEEYKMHKNSCKGSTKGTNPTKVSFQKVTPKDRILDKPTFTKTSKNTVHTAVPSVPRRTKTLNVNKKDTILTPRATTESNLLINEKQTSPNSWLTKKDSNAIHDIVKLLGDMKLSKQESIVEDERVAPEIAPEVHLYNDQGRIQKTCIRREIGVLLENKLDASRVTVLTPKKASKKEQQELGVSQVITPVRRSVRHGVHYEPTLDDEDGFKEMSQQDRIDLLLKSHDFAFTPNAAL